MKVKLIHYLLISPVQLMLVALIFLPALYVGWLSFYESSFGMPPRFVGWKNYVFLLHDPHFWRALWNTLLIVNVVVYGELLLGLGMAVLFAGGVPLQKVMISLVLAPYAISPVIGVLMWKYMLEPEVGVLNSLLRLIHLPEIAWTTNPVHALLVIILLSIWLHTPFTFMILYASILAIPQELFEAARIDGASSWQIFWHLTVRIIMPSILVALLFRYIFAFRIFSEVWILTQGGPVRTTEVLSIYLYRYGFRYYEFGTAAATGWVMVIVTLLIALYYFRIMYKRMFAYEA